MPSLTYQGPTTLTLTNSEIITYMFIYLVGDDDIPLLLFTVSSIVLLYVFVYEHQYEVIYDPTNISLKSQQPTPVKANQYKGFNISALRI